MLCFAHPEKCSSHLSPYDIITVLLTLSSVLYFSSWELNCFITGCSYLFLSVSCFTSPPCLPPAIVALLEWTFIRKRTVGFYPDVLSTCSWFSHHQILSTHILRARNWFPSQGKLYLGWGLSLLVGLIGSINLLHFLTKKASKDAPGAAVNESFLTLSPAFLGWREIMTKLEQWLLQGFIPPCLF